MWETVLALDMFLLGWLLSTMSEHYYIRLKAQPQWRTAMCVSGQFYYVVPEREYCDLISAWNLQNLKVYESVSAGVSEGHRGAYIKTEP